MQNKCEISLKNALYAVHYATIRVFEVTRYAMQECTRDQLYHYKDQYSSMSSDSSAGFKNSHVKDIEIMPRRCGKMLTLLFVYGLLFTQDLQKAFFYHMAVYICTWTYRHPINSNQHLKQPAQRNMTKDIRNTLELKLILDMVLDWNAELLL